MVAMLDKEVVAACHADAVVCAVQEALGLERHLLIFFSASQAEGDAICCYHYTPPGVQVALQDTPLAEVMMTAFHGGHFYVVCAPSDLVLIKNDPEFPEHYPGLKTYLVAGMGG